MESSIEFPKPKYVTGGCVCESLTYRIDFPENHDFEASWTSSNTDTLGLYNATPAAERGFCTACGSFLYWRRVKSETDTIDVAVGTIDPQFLFGEGADGVEVPKGGFGVALAGGTGGHVWCVNEIPGVTDKMEYLHGRGRRWSKE
ncbi:hypothetical protein E0Z10_g7382 [Xylaria hypoxylon]|uniref:CENP-V/GFA domain-containing protein n=1 Tax=Xylaria hypoxylon TaxID=37992 RepID=A0A4Z0YMY6_9PEZI|nr:hypothetical protein E0Z10_g7382 [Xylaria hypoxylon]